MGTATFVLGTVLLLGSWIGSPPAQGAGEVTRSYILTPDAITDEEGRTVEVERGLVFVPESRRDPKSRLIAVHFIRFPAIEPAAIARAPVFLLPGGPGWGIDFTDPLFFSEVERLRRTRSVVYVSQRGYSGDPGLVPAMRVRYDAVPIDSITPARVRADRDRATLGIAAERWKRRGIDVAGYDILNITDDLNDLRQALGYDRIILRGCSFGSQWSLAYMRRWPETVDRALLSGVEPLDFGYDSPAALWSSMVRVARAAEADPALAPAIPPGGIMRALSTIVARLDAKPVAVTIRDPDDDRQIVVPIGADDLRAALTGLSLDRRRALDNLAQWPRFILEIYAGDYRFLATRVVRNRRTERSEALILPLINHSVGISAARADRLRREPEARWLGDINLKESVTRSAAPTPQVGDAFRADRRIAIPTLLINEDYDWSTPIENARHLAGLLDRGKLVTVTGGRHCTETNHGELAMQHPERTSALYAFVDADFNRTPASAVLAATPETVALAPIDFAPLGGRSLYDEWLAARR